MQLDDGTKQTGPISGNILIYQLCASYFQLKTATTKVIKGDEMDNRQGTMRPLENWIIRY